MKRFSRREFVEQMAMAITLSAGSLPACTQRPKREAVLEAIVRGIVAPDSAALAADSHVLDETVHRLVREPSPAILADARNAWKRALLAWKRAYCFRNGPIVQSNALLRAMFWPPRQSAIDAALQSDRVVDVGFLEELGVDAKGLFALESFLFSASHDDGAVLARFAGAGGDRIRQFSGALASSVTEYADGVARAIGGGTVYAATFARGGQESVNRLVNQMVDTMESGVAGRLIRVAELEENHRLTPSEIEGWPSGTSRDIVLAYATSTERLYSGGAGMGLADLVHGVAPAIDRHLREVWSKLLSSLRAMTAPLERTVKVDRPALMQGARAAKEVEVALKTELASALGVTLTFSAGDGD
jgi:uncharacterized protein